MRRNAKERKELNALIIEKTKHLTDTEIIKKIKTFYERQTERYISHECPNCTEIFLAEDIFNSSGIQKWRYCNNCETLGFVSKKN